MESTYSTIEELRERYPNEWVLLGEPKMRNTVVLGGILLYHSADKKEVCYIGRDKTAGYSSVTIAFAGDLKQQRKIGILRRV